MGELSERDKLILLGPRYNEIEERERLSSNSRSAKWKGIVVVAVFAAIIAAIILADVGFALGH